jgi:hypothetical protein
MKVKARQERVKSAGYFRKSKRANLRWPLLLTNPLNSCTKLQIETTLQNKFLEV